MYEIDGKPALDMYLRFLGEDFASTDDQVKFFDSVGLHYPLQIERKEREPMMCNPMGYNKEENALILESDVAQGSRFRFSTPPDFDILETVVEKAKEIKGIEQEDAKAVLIFSCASRLSALGPMAQQENEELACCLESAYGRFLYLW
ncbi:MAG: FIST C-terminal domain-containing protein [Nocardioidaceae bacterium]